jgi:hypothetical protein
VKKFNCVWHRKKRIKNSEVFAIVIIQTVVFCATLMCDVPIGPDLAPSPPPCRSTERPHFPQLAYRTQQTPRPYTLSNFDRHTPTSNLHKTFEIHCVSYIAELRRWQAEVVQNHNSNVRRIWQSENIQGFGDHAYEY